MSEIRGEKGFESPSQEELDVYLKQSKKSLTQMKDGKPPIIFKPKRLLPFKFIGILILIIISSSIILGGSFINFDFLRNDGNDDLTTQITTSSSITTSKTTQSETTQPTDIDSAIITSIPQVEAFINTMIAPNQSLINPVIVNGTINQSQTITDLELFDLVWILSQFDENSEWWNLGRKLIFETYLLWNKTIYLTGNLQNQLLALRSLISYSPEKILLEANDFAFYQNFSKELWENVSSAYNNETGIFNPNNTTEINTYDQIIFSQVLAKAAVHETLFDINKVTEMAILLLETVNAMAAPTDGLSESFDTNLTVFSDIYYSRHQTEMILALGEFSSLLGSLPIINTLINQLNNFLTNIFLRQDWSIALSYNHTSPFLSTTRVLNDQLFFIRANIIQNKRNFAEYTINFVRSNFGNENSSYFTSTVDNENQFLIDHVHLLLSFEEFLKLEKTDTSDTKTEFPTDMAGITSEFGIILIVLVIIVYRRRNKN